VYNLMESFYFHVVILQSSSSHGHCFVVSMLFSPSSNQYVHVDRRVLVVYLDHHINALPIQLSRVS
jgi:hypothetical protein